MFRKNKPIRNDLIQCAAFLILGFGSFFPFVPEAWKDIFDAVELVMLVVLLLASMALDWQSRNMPPEEKRDLERESRDERNLMICSRAALFCEDVEDWLLIVLCALILLFTDYRGVACVLYWTQVFRYLLFAAARWWINRKY